MNENLGQKNFSFAKDFQNRVDELPRRNCETWGDETNLKNFRRVFRILIFKFF
jgi:hypothetical protein